MKRMGKKKSLKRTLVILGEIILCYLVGVSLTGKSISVTPLNKK